MEAIVSHLDITQIFCEVDDFCQRFEQLMQPQLQLPGRHRSPLNFLVNLVSGLVAYTYQAHKPTLDLYL